MKNLQDIITDYAFSKMNDHGLLLLPLPTGAGKSFTIFKFIHDTIVSGIHKEKIIFITSLKKNLQPEELRERFSEDEIKFFDEKVLYLKSNTDCVLQNLRTLVESDGCIPDTIKELKEFKNLWAAVSFCLKMENNTDFSIQDAIKTKKDEIQNTLERAFRQKIRRIIDSEIKTKLGLKVGYKQKLDFLKSSKNKWTWLLRLYPQIMTKEKQVYLMSMDKFLLRNDPIIEKNYFIYKELAKNAIIFIDEFDATKETILNRLIENAVKSRIDYVSAYKQIHDRLSQGDFPAEMTTASKSQLASTSRGYGQEKLNAVIPGWKKRSDEIYERFDMKYLFKKMESENEEAAFLFQDIHSMTISGKDKSKEITIRTSEKKRINEISYAPNEIETNAEAKSFKYMIKDVRGFLKFFCGGVQILATNLTQLKYDNGDEVYTYEDAVSSILDNFFPSDSFSKMKQYFTEEILLYRNNKDENKKKEFDGSFIENGFTYFAIEDDNQHSLRSAIMMTSLESTPEKILLELCEKAKVFGVSATANYDTIIGNYAIGNYLIPKLKERFYELDDEENKILKEHFEKSISHYEKVKIHPIEIHNDANYSEESWKSVFSNEYDCEEAYNIVSQTLSAAGQDSGCFLRNRYLRIASVFKNFIEKEDIQSLLCLLNAFPDKKSELNNDVLEELFNKIACNQCSFKENVRILRGGNDYEQKKDSILKELESGKKILVISTYATIGAGQNLLYGIPETLKNTKGNQNGLLHINDFSPSDRKDFDAIYLDKPTYLLTQISDTSDDCSFVKYLSQVEYLKTSGEISLADANRRIKEAFRLKYYGNRKLKFKQSDLDSYSNFATKVLVQAIGRICRRNMKRPNIYIFFDDSISEVVNKNACGSNLLNPEFKVFLNYIKDCNTHSESDKKFEQAAENKSDEALTRIIKYVSDGRNGWKENAISEWQKIRHFVLKHPTLSEEEFNKCDDLYQPLYIKLPTRNDKVWYKREGDFNDISIFFDSNLGSECVSSEAARLEKMLAISQVQKIFNQECFSKKFEVNDYIVCPPVFTNIYKGALGEYAGKSILESFGIELEEIKNCDFFELFDYKIKGKDIYVDFKHWEEYSAFIPKVTETLPHIYDKLSKCDGKKAIIINIFAEKEYWIKNHRKSDFEIVEIPKLYDEKNLALDQKALDKIIQFVNGSK